MHRGLANTLWMVFSVNCQGSNGLESRGYMDSRGACHSVATCARLRACETAHHSSAVLQVELPANTKIEYKYVILEEQVGHNGLQASAIALDSMSLWLHNRQAASFLLLIHTVTMSSVPALLIPALVMDAMSNANGTATSQERKCDQYLLPSH